MLHESQDDDIDEQDLDVNHFDLDGPAKAVEVPSIFKGELKHY